MTTRSEKKIARALVAGVPRAQAERRLAQSAKDSANNRKAKKRVRRKMKKLNARLGDNLRSQGRLSMVREVSRSMSARRNEYLLTLMHPDKYMSHIPDMITFPRGLQQIRSVFTISTWTDDTPDKKFSHAAFDKRMKHAAKLNGKKPEEVAIESLKRKSGEPGPLVLTSDNSVIFNAYPWLASAFDAYNGIYEMDGITFSDEVFDCYGLTQWVNILAGFRAVSMSVNLTYIGPTLTNSGEMAVACFPSFWNPAAATPTTFSAVSAYNFSYTGAARDGCYQVWTPAGSDDFTVKSVNFGVASGTVLGIPFIAVAAKGLPLPAVSTGTVTTLPVFRAEVVLNIESYSVAQVLTATQKAGNSDPSQFHGALNTMGQAIEHKVTNGPGGPSGASSVYSSIAEIAKSAAGFAWDNRQTIIPAITSLAGLVL